jgi:NAD(P)-dependent dehydrogenase (short-subunit alcohol dehydrogenase family)
MSLSAVDLTGKVAIVTGAGGDIGYAYARGLAAAGAAVVLADLDGEAAQSNAKDIAGGGGTAAGVRTDITDIASVQAMVDFAVQTYGGLDILVNNAALMAQLPRAPLHEFPLEWWDRVIDVNLRGTLLCCQAAVPALKARGGGSIINQSSAGAFNLSGAYSVTKLAIVGMTVVLAKDLGKDGIRVNAIAPGVVNSAAGREAATGALKDKVAALAPLHPVGEPDELVGPLLFLVSEQSAWMTGHTLNVDGGWIMRV